MRRVYLTQCCRMASTRACTRTYNPILLLSGLFLSALLLSTAAGCGGSGPYPAPRVTTAVGRAGPCEFCRKPIEMVGEEHMITVGSSRFPVCGGTCGAKLREKLENQ